MRLLKPSMIQPTYLIGFCGFLILLIGGCRTGEPFAGETNEGPFRDLLGAVVRIDVREASFASGAKRVVSGVGSGVIMNEDGYVLTNAHVVGPMAESILVTLANLERVNARFVGWDHWTDLALIQLEMEAIQNRGLNFEVARFGDSETLYAGQEVFAVGTPNGLTRTVTKGIISNPKRYFAANSQIRGYETGFFNTWLQTDAAINPGNSGGPLVLRNGQVIGINTLSYLGANNLSFAVPSSIAQRVMERLLAEGEVERSYIGLKLAPLRDLETFFGLESNIGVLVDGVDPGSPASKLGVRAGDILLEVNGVAVDGRFPEQLPSILNQIAELPRESPVGLKLLRRNEPMELTVVTEALESRMGRQGAFEEWGVSVQELSKAIAREQNYDTDDGLLVIGLQGAFPAEDAGLNRGDVILSVNREPVASIEDLESAYEDFVEGKANVLLEVRRHFQISYLVLKP